MQMLPVCSLLLSLVSAAYAQSPAFRVDPYWPMPLPHNWILGQVGGMATDAQNHLGVLSVHVVDRRRERRCPLRRRARNAACRRRRCWSSIRPATSSNRGAARRNLGYDWPALEHGILVDPKGFVWLGGNGKGDGMVFKFTNDGKFVMQTRQTRPAEEEHGYERVRPSGRAQARCRGQRDLRRRRLRQSPHHGVRRG